MDPADTDSLPHAISMQGLLLGKHEQLLKEVMDSIQTLASSVHQLMALVSANATASAPSEPASSVPAPVSTREPLIRPPEHCSGELGVCSRFLLQCSLVFEQQPSLFSTNRARLAYVVNLLRGKAGEWANSLWEVNAACLVSFEAFSADLQRVFHWPFHSQASAHR